MKTLIVLRPTRNNSEILAFSSLFEHREGLPPTVLAVVPRDDPALNSKAEKWIAEARIQLDLPGLVTKIRIGDLCDQVNQEVADGDYDLVIVGERKTSYLDHLVHRFRAVTVAESVPCSAIVFKGKSKPIRRILLCDSGAGRSSLLNRFTADIAHILPGDEEVTVLHVMSQISAGPGILGKDLRATTDELIQEHSLEGRIVESDMQALEEQGVQSTPMVRHGLVVDEILAEAREGDYDLVIVGAHAYQSPHSFLLENIAKQVLRKINKPVMVVRSRVDSEPG